MTVVSIRGTHGSGKSTIVRKILDKYPNVPLIRGKKRPDGYWLAPPTARREIFVVGPYHTACGGCDAIQPYSDILDLVSQAYSKGCDVLLEGALVSSSYGTLGVLMNQLPDPVFAFLDTPLELCGKRIADRRLAKWIQLGKPGLPPPVDMTNTVAKFHNVLRTKEQMAKLESVIRAVDIDHTKPVQQIMKLFGVTLRKEP